MAEPVAFPSTTTNFALPLLFAGQTQKEFTLNQSLIAIDALLLNSVLETRDIPPQEVEDGATYRVAHNASEAWVGRDGQIAIAIGGAWMFVQASDGMMLFDRSTKQHLFHNEGWQSAQTPPSAEGGAVIDAEARAMLSGLVEALRTVGILPIEA